MKKPFILWIVLFVLIASCSKKTAPAEKSVDVAAIFSKNCAPCHGADGKSGRAPNLSKTGLDKAALVDIITHGHDHMPEFGDKLSTVEISAVSKWILTLKS